jgi:hypothetical protein
MPIIMDLFIDDLDKYLPRRGSGPLPAPARRELEEKEK